MKLIKMMMMIIDNIQLSEDDKETYDNEDAKYI